MSTADDPGAAYLPFDAARTGTCPERCGAIILLENLEQACSAACPRSTARWSGTGRQNDAHHWRDPEPTGYQHSRAIWLALADAGIEPGDIDVVFADAFGTLERDQIEAEALKSGLDACPGGARDRSQDDGRTALRRRSVARRRRGAARDARRGDPADDQSDQPAEGCDLQFVTAAREAEVRTALVTARGYGGFNAALVLRREV